MEIRLVFTSYDLAAVRSADTCGNLHYVIDGGCDQSDMQLRLIEQLVGSTLVLSETNGKFAVAVEEPQKGTV